MAQRLSSRLRGDFLELARQAFTGGRYVFGAFGAMLLAVLAVVSATVGR